MVKGFFSNSALSGKPAASLIPACGACGLFKHCQSPKMPVSGEGRKGLLVVAESPGETEDSRGLQLCGASGRLLESTLAKFNIDMRKDAWLTSALICRSHDAGQNRSPTPLEIEHCRPNLTKTVKELNPIAILCLGGPAVSSLLGDIWKDGQGYTISRWAGWQIPCQALNAWIIPTYHPAYVLREANSTLQMFWERHLEYAANKVKTRSDPMGDMVNLVCEVERRPWKNGTPDWGKRIDVILNDKEAAERIMLMTEAGLPLAWDLETTTKKPDSDVAEIFSCSISDGKRAISYPWRGEAIQATESFLKSSVPKIGFNLKFEMRWSMSKLGIRPKNWIWDGMVNGHVLDCRQGITSLHFQSFVRLGIGKAKDGMDEYLSSDGSNTANRIRQADLSKVLFYGGWDALLEYMVAKKQMKEVGISVEGMI